VTVFHLSFFLDPRPDALAPGGGADASAPAPARPPPTAAQLAAQSDALRRATAGVAPFELEVGAG
jgi:hypothetical protein